MKGKGHVAARKDTSPLSRTRRRSQGRVASLMDASPLSRTSALTDIRSHGHAAGRHSWIYFEYPHPLATYFAFLLFFLILEVCICFAFLCMEMGPGGFGKASYKLYASF